MHGRKRAIGARHLSLLATGMNESLMQTCAHRSILAALSTPTPLAGRLLVGDIELLVGVNLRLETCSGHFKGIAK